MSNNSRRLSSVTILVLVILIPFLLIIEQIAKPMMIDYLIKKLEPENPTDMIVKLQFMFSVFPWAAYFTMIGTFAGISQMRRGAESVSNSIGNRHNQEIQDSGK